MAKAKQVRRKKPKRDPNQPKKPLTAYFRYLADVRTTTKEANPDLKAKELTKLIGKKWRELPAEEKTVYEEPAKAALEKWREEMADYKKTDTYKDFQKEKELAKQEPPAGSKRKKKYPKDKNAPKRPATAYFLYSASVRESVKASMEEGMRNQVKEVAKKMGAGWKALSEEEKTEWKAKHAKLKEEYEEQLAAYKLTDQYREYNESKATWEKEQKQKEQAARAAAAKKNKKKPAAKRRRQKLEESSDESDSEMSEDSSSMSSSTDNESGSS